MNIIHIVVFFAPNFGYHGIIVSEGMSKYMSQAYFKQMNTGLKQAGIAYPTLLIDKSRLDQNIGHLKNALKNTFNFRIVAKSLPSIEMLQYIMTKTATNRLMCFHLPFVIKIIQSLPDVDILLGKPMPVDAVRAFYQWYLSDKNTTSFDHEKKMQWLVDSDARLQNYESLARSLGITLNINLEIDIGLHRGGYNNDLEFIESLERIKSSSSLTLSGLMGYEAHITKIPAFLGGPEKAELSAKANYRHFVKLVRDHYGDTENLCLNAGGSTTYPLYGDDDVCNEISTASALVKPSDFDVYTLKHHQAATFIAAPILKKVNKPELPMAKSISTFLRAIKLVPEHACFIYGGNWLAKPCYPKSAKHLTIFGSSSNQEMYSLPDKNDLQEEDFIFFRPTQSEATFLQFGKIALYEHGKIVDWWSVFDYPDLTPLSQTILKTA